MAHNHDRQLKWHQLLSWWSWLIIGFLVARMAQLSQNQGDTGFIVAGIYMFGVLGELTGIAKAVTALYRKITKKSSVKSTPLSKQILVTILVPAIAFMFFAIPVYISESSSSNKQPASSTVQPPTRQELLKLVNAERSKVGASPLVEDPRLDQSAQWKADDMVNRNYFAHADPKTGKNNGLDYIQSIDRDCSYISENLVQGGGPYAGTAQMLVKSWVSSKAHYAAMIDTKYSLTGFGIAGDSHNYKVVEHFCQTQ